MKSSKGLNMTDLDYKKDNRPEFIQKISDWWLFDFHRIHIVRRFDNIFYNLKHGIKNLIRWIPIIWKDRDWSGDYVIDILIKKLEFQRKTLIASPIVHQDELDDMNTNMTACIDLLKKSNDEWENYKDPFLKLHEAKWGKSDYVFEKIEGEDLFEMLNKNDETLSEEEEEIEGEDLFEMLNKNDETLSEEEKEIKHEEYRAGMKNAEDARIKDLKKALEIFGEHIDEWWD